jgi:hypothetical protein
VPAAQPRAPTCEEEFAPAPCPAHLHSIQRSGFVLLADEKGRANRQLAGDVAAARRSREGRTRGQLAGRQAARPPPARVHQPPGRRTTGVADPSARAWLGLWTLVRLGLPRSESRDPAVDMEGTASAPGISIEPSIIGFRCLLFCS